MEDFTMINIQDLMPGCGSTGEMLVGIVISKRDIRAFQDAKSDNGSMRQVFSFTLRDSPAHWLTVSVWGDEPFTNQLNQLFRVGDIVELTNFQVQSKTENNEKFNPGTNSQVCVHVSQRSNGNIATRSGSSAAQLSTLARIPLCRANDFYTLAEAGDQEINFSDRTVNLLACVKKVGCMQQLTSKTGKELYKVEAILLDETSNSFLITIWDKGACEWATSWVEMGTVVFASDVRVFYSDFKKRVVASSTCRTVFICNPDTEEAHRLHQYAQDYAEQAPTLFVAGELTDDTAGDELPLEQRTIEQVKAAVRDGNREMAAEKALVMAAVTHLDIDSSVNNFYAFRCSSCGHQVGSESAVACPNQKCPTAVSGHELQVHRAYDVRIDLSDHTGSLQQCRLSGKAAEAMFGMKLEEFLKLSLDDTTALKWRWLLERVRCSVRCSLSRYGNLFTRVDACARATSEQILQSAVLEGS